MSDFGKTLRETRERRGVSLRQIAATTKISIAALEALERNDSFRFRLAWCISGADARSVEAGTPGMI